MFLFTVAIPTGWLAYPNYQIEGGFGIATMPNMLDVDISYADCEAFCTA